MDKGQIEVARRDTRTKESLPMEGISKRIVDLLDDIQSSLLKKALDYRADHTSKADDLDSFKTLVEEKGGFVSAHWDGTTESELKIKELTKATLRCIPIDAEEEEGKDLISGAPSQKRVLFAKAY